MIENKSGRWSAEDKQFIAENVDKMDYQKIAKALKRNEDAVKKYIAKNHASAFVEQVRTAEYDIQNSSVWKDLERQFSKDELEMFLFHWGRIVGQFDNNVYPTEELQVIDTIKLELLMNRAMSQQQSILNDIKDLERRILIEKQQDPPNLVEINNMERQVAIYRAAQDSLNNDFMKMLGEKNKILKDMKATREARIKNLESSKQNFLGFLRSMMENRPLRLKIGREMEKMRLATIAEYERLSEWHQYQDGEVDQPLLTPDNVIEE